MECCPRCGRRAVVRWSDQLRADVCERCLPVVSPAPQRSPYTRPKGRKPTRFEAFHARVWHRLEFLTDSEVFLMEVGRIACYCPRCLDGTMMVRIRDAEKPLITITADGHEGCSLGCTEREVGEVLFR